MTLKHDYWLSSIAIPVLLQKWAVDICADTHNPSNKKDYLKKLDTEKDYTALAFNYVAS